MHKFLALIILSFIISVCGFAQPKIQNPQFYPTSDIGLYDKVEIRLNLPEYQNNYDPEVIQLKVQLRAPSGKKISVPGFYYVNYIKQYDFDCGLEIPCERLVKNPNQSYNWIIRFALDEVGIWEYQITATDKNGKTSFPQNDHGKFQVKVKENKGFISQLNDRYLGRDGKHLFLVGGNICWFEIQLDSKNASYKQETGTNDYKRHIDSLSNAKANFMRVWVNIYPGISLTGREWTNGEFHNFDNLNQKDAWQLDQIMSYAAEKDIDVILCLLSATAFTNHYYNDWESSNAFNSLNKETKIEGVTSPFEIFYNDEAIKQTENLFHYTIARWSYATNLVGWELWNEENQILNLLGDDTLRIPPVRYLKYVIEWHNSMADFFDKNDPYLHLVTTSSPDERCCADKEHPYVWFKQDMVITHDYMSMGGLSSPFVFNKRLLKQANEVINHPQLTDKPFMCQEWGIYPLDDFHKLDPHGYELHCNLWSSSMSGACGAIAFWSWDKYIQRQNLYKKLEPVSVFMNSVVTELNGTNKGYFAISKNLGIFYMKDTQEKTIIGWCQDQKFAFSTVKDSKYILDLKTNRPKQKYRHQKMKLSCNSHDQVYTVKWYDSQTAQLVSEEKIVSKKNIITFHVPAQLYESPFGDGVFIATKE